MSTSQATVIVNVSKYITDPKLNNSENY